MSNDLIENFFGLSHIPEEISCPHCGSLLRAGVNGKNLILHIRWHKNLVKAINIGRAYEGNT